MYADDIVLLTESEHDWKLEVNLTKTNIMHVRGNRKQQSSSMFLFNHTVTHISIMGAQLKSIWILNTHTVDLLAASAGRALCLIITKMIKNGGFSYHVFCTFYQSCLCSFGDYERETFWVCEIQFST